MSGDYERQTRRHYTDASVAAEYAARQRLLRSPADWLHDRLEVRAIRALRRRAPGPAHSTLDVPAGTGKLTPVLADGGRYVAADMSREMLSYLQSDQPKSVADITALPFRTDSFDSAVSLRLFHRVPRPVIEAGIRDLTRVARHSVIASYGSSSKVAGLHRVARRITRRAEVPGFLALSPGDVSEIARSHGWRVVADRSVTGGLTRERVALLVPGR